MRVAEQRDRALILDGVAVGAGHQLVEQRQRVAWRATTGTHHERKHPWSDLHLLTVAQFLHVFEHLRGWHQPERVVVGA